MSIFPVFDSFSQGRFYQLSLVPSRGEEHWSWPPAPVLGQWQKALTKAVTGRYSSVLLSPESVNSGDYVACLSATRESGLQPIQQVFASQLNRIYAENAGVWQKQPVAFDILVDHLPREYPLWDQLLLGCESSYLTVLCLKQFDALEHLKFLPSRFHERVHLCFPYGQRQWNHQCWTPKQVMRWREQLSRWRMEACWRPSRGVDIFEPQIQPTFELESLAQPIFRRAEEVVPKVSVVIPCYNSQGLVLQTLKHLQKQSLDTSKYEIIVVDDGSHDNCSEELLQLLEELSMQVTLIYFPRPQPRKMGDSQFRAGVSRNLGVKWARGEVLSFLDCDILVPENYLEKILEQIEQHDVVMWRRDYLNSSAKPYSGYADIDGERDCYIPEGGYWHNFFKEAADIGWENVGHYWKYVCTYSLSMRRDLFEQVGWFRKTFCFYGFEDTDLGWRLVKKNKKFYFHDQPVYHLYQKEDRSEFLNSNFRRQKLLRKTARTFFYNNLEPEIYEVFRNYLREGFWS